MKGDPENGALVDLLVGLVFAGAGVLCLVDAF
jgi:hypothetical protein